MGMFVVGYLLHIEDRQRKEQAYKDCILADKPTYTCASIVFCGR